MSFFLQKSQTAILDNPASNLNSYLITQVSLHICYKVILISKVVRVFVSLSEFHALQNPIFIIMLSHIIPLSWFSSVWECSHVCPAALQRHLCISRESFCSSKKCFLSHPVSVWVPSDHLLPCK